MGHSLGWTVNHPGHIVFLLDLSQSMRGEKIKVVMDVLRQTCVKLLGNAENDEGEIDNSFSTTIIGYNRDVKRLFPLSGDGNALELEKLLLATKGQAMFDYSEGGVAEPKWQTFTADAFAAARKDVEAWINTGNRNLKPAPVIIHITDGHPEENDDPLSSSISKALREAEAIKGIKSADGSALLFNFYINPKSNMATRFPVSAPQVQGDDGEFLKFLFESSSVMEDGDIKKALAEGFREARTNSRFMVVNEADRAAFAKLIIFVSSMGFLSAGTVDREPVKPQ